MNVFVYSLFVFQPIMINVFLSPTINKTRYVSLKIHGHYKPLMFLSCKKLLTGGGKILNLIVN